MVVLFLIVFVGMVGFGILLPIFPFYAERVGASPTVITWTMAAYTIAQAFAAPIWGRISDAYGRRVVLIVTMIGSAFAYVLLAFADSLWLVIASRVLGGAMGGLPGAADGPAEGQVAGVPRGAVEPVEIAADFGYTWQRAESKRCSIRDRACQNRPR